MPEGPSVKNWSTKAEKFIGRKIKVVDGNTHVVDKQALVGCTLSSVEAYGKQLFLCFSPCQTDVITKDSDTANQDKTGEHDTGDCEKIWLRYHFLMWGSLRANELKGPSKRSKTQKIPTPRLLIRFQDEEFLAFYNGSVQYVEEPCPDNETDILKTNFDVEKATASVQSNRPVCYTLLDQKVFSGLGNIMKNEALYTSRLHPLELGTDLTKEEAMTLVNEAVKFSAMWMEYEKNRVFKETWSKFSGEFQIYKKHRCPEGHKTKRDWFGDGLKRMTVWCPECQPLKGKESKMAKCVNLMPLLAIKGQKSNQGKQARR
ncbi:LOW QUALITY PROTEIN: endonuclease 8-like 2 [Ptychodera flava]|uniref:LOW QUALITY PROTEIN: endonuclease 8-like 2 n=1 Tax=Ptychodera flava TaxID=63121 RepID=UPI00396AA1DE